MKKIILILLILVISTPSALFAGVNEEKACFKLLNDAVKADNRFNNSSTSSILINGDLSKVLYNEESSSDNNFSKYSNFLDYRVENKNAHNTNGLDKYDFIARRNNIGTVIANDNYVISNIVGFGRDSNFDFPLDSETTPYGDKYELNGDFFKEFVLYTHHNFEGDFMSCGIVKVKPLGGKSFTNISQSGYKTNIITGNNCSSGFEGDFISQGGLDYYKLKSNVCVVDYNDEDYLKMEVISIAYDNGSSYMNEYITHQLQVKAMDDLGNNAEGGLKGISDTFLEYLDEKTCLSLIHGSKSKLPSACNGNYGSELLSYNNSKSLFSYIIPSVNAKRGGLTLEKEVEESKGMVVYDDLPYFIYKKLNSITDETFKSYLLLSIVPNLEDLINNRKDNNILLSPYEETFLQCGINYKERSKILQDFIKNIENIENIDYNNLSYSNSKFGDCIIPYPDKINLSKEIENSFGSNKLLAQKINGSYKATDISVEMQDYIKEIRKVELDYNESINDLSIKFNNGEITQQELIEKNINEKELFDESNRQIEEKYNDIDKQINKKIKESADSLNNAGLVEKNKNINYKTIMLILLIFIIGGATLFVSLKKKTK